MAPDQPTKGSVPTTATLRQFTETTEQFVLFCVTQLRRFPTHGDLVEQYRQQGRGAVHLWSFVAIQIYGVSAEVERAEYDRLQTLIEDAARQVMAQSRLANDDRLGVEPVFTNGVAPAQMTRADTDEPLQGNLRIEPWLTR